VFAEALNDLADVVDDPALPQAARSALPPPPALMRTTARRTVRLETCAMAIFFLPIGLLTFGYASGRRVAEVGHFQQGAALDRRVVRDDAG
jgi:hypothetical protein